MMNSAQVLAVILVIAAVTYFTRCLPFLIFPADKPTPRYIAYLGQVLPCAIIGMLVVYCLKGVDLAGSTHGIPEAISVLFVVAVHKWRHNLLFSIVGGTVLYMLLIRIVPLL